MPIIVFEVIQNRYPAIFLTYGCVYLLDLKSKGIFLVLLVLLSAILVAGCTGNGADSSTTEPTKAISIGYMLWDTEIASANVQYFKT